VSKDRILHILTENVYPYLTARLGVTTCLSMSMIVGQVLWDELSIHNGVVTAVVTYGNQEFRTAVRVIGWDELNRSIQANGWPTSTMWSVGLGAPRPGVKNPLHAVIYLPDTNEIIDMGAPQAHRPLKDILIPGPIWTSRKNPEPPMVSCKWYSFPNYKPVIERLSKAKQMKIHQTVSDMLAV